MALVEISKAEFDKMLANAGTVDSVVNPLMTYLKKGSGPLIVRDRRYPIP